MNSLKSISDFYVVGINYRKTDAAVRGHFAVSNTQYEHLLAIAPDYNVQELFVLSTCNRTEIYGIAATPEDLVRLLCSQTKGDRATFEAAAYIYQGKEAIEHLLHVSAGLDSQILGDYEVISQIKLAVQFAKEKGFVGLFLEKLLHNTLQSSRSIRSKTHLSSGSVSVSFAAVQYIEDHAGDITGKKILLLGIGKIGRNTCKNITGHLGTRNITLVNRTNEKASELAAELGLHYAPYDRLAEEVKAADIILVATNAPEPTILPQHVQSSGPKIIIDLSIPYNADPQVAELADIRLVNVDELSRVGDKTLEARQAEVPKAKAIIAEHIAEFREWYLMRKNVPVIKAVKHKLESLQHCLVCDTDGSPDNDKIQKVLNNMASKMRHRNEGGCNYIAALNDFMTRS